MQGVTVAEPSDQAAIALTVARYPGAQITRMYPVDREVIRFLNLAPGRSAEWRPLAGR